MSDEPPLEDKPWLANPESCRQLRLRCGSARTRTISRPHRWEPSTVRIPGSDDYYDTASAWALICALLTQGVEVEEMTLDQPAGKKGYVLFGEGVGGQRIYIKLMFLGNLVAGRSFHISDEKSRQR